MVFTRHTSFSGNVGWMSHLMSSLHQETPNRISPYNPTGRDSKSEHHPISWCDLGSLPCMEATHWLYGAEGKSICQRSSSRFGQCMRAVHPVTACDSSWTFTTVHRKLVATYAWAFSKYDKATFMCACQKATGRLGVRGATSSSLVIAESRDPTTHALRAQETARQFLRISANFKDRSAAWDITDHASSTFCQALTTHNIVTPTKILSISVFQRIHEHHQHWIFTWTSQE